MARAKGHQARVDLAVEALQRAGLLIVHRVLPIAMIPWIDHRRHGLRRRGGLPKGVASMTETTVDPVWWAWAQNAAIGPVQARAKCLCPETSKSARPQVPALTVEKNQRKLVFFW